MLKKSTLGAGGLALVGLAFIGLMLLANLFLRAQVDLTHDDLYTISEGTERIVRAPKEPVNLYFFFSEKSATPIPPLRNHGVRVRELLEALVARSNGKLTLKVVDPEPFSEEEDRATEFGINAMPLNTAGDRLYLGLAGTNSVGDKEAIGFLDPKREELLEYDVAQMVYKLSVDKKPVVGWISSLNMQGEFNMQTGRPSPPWAVYQQIEQLYTLRSLEPTLTSVPDDIDVLVLVHPKNLQPAALYAIDQFALRGGHVLVFVDPNAQQDPAAAPDPNNPMAQLGADSSSNLAPLLAAWGIDYKPGEVVADLQRGLNVSMRENDPPSQHIAILGLDNSAMSKDVITGQLDSVNVATAGSLKAVEGSKLTFEPLIKTSSQAGVLPAQKLVMLQDPAVLKDGFKPTGELVIAARATGNATSAFPEGPPAGATAAPNALKESAKPLNVVVIADTDLLSDFMWVNTSNFFGQTVIQPFANNGELVWNSLDNLGGSNDLISIRARAAYSRPFDRVEALRRDADARFRSTEQQLEQELQQTEEALSKMQSAQPGNGDPILSPDMARQLESFQQKKLSIRKELRAVKAGLERDIKALGFRMKLINVLLMPTIIIAIGLFVAVWRKKRRHAIAMLRKGSAA